ncbi:MAG: DUF5110 domain-containing protein, partial [Chlorobi bacterium]|nr:DUF5110 domain-containing protein [Chlorobiota bacterium]
GHGVTLDTGDIFLEAGRKYRLTIEYFQLLGNAITRLAWITPSVRDTLAEQKIPPVKSTKVYLPAGSDWFDFWRGNIIKGGQTIQVPAPLDEIPLFVKTGSIIPLGPDLQYADERPADTLELRVYPGADAQFILYEDENDNYNYEKGIYATIPIRWDEENKELTIGKRHGKFPGMLKKRIFRIVWVRKGHGTGVTPVKNPDKTVKYDGKRIVITKHQD